ETFKKIEEDELCLGYVNVRGKNLSELVTVANDQEDVSSFIVKKHGFFYAGQVVNMQQCSSSFEEEKTNQFEIIPVLQYARDSKCCLIQFCKVPARSRHASADIVKNLTSFKSIPYSTLFHGDNYIDVEKNQSYVFFKVFNIHNGVHTFKKQDQFNMFILLIVSPGLELDIGCSFSTKKLFFKSTLLGALQNVTHCQPQALTSKDKFGVIEFKSLTESLVEMSSETLVDGSQSFLKCKCSHNSRNNRIIAQKKKILVAPQVLVVKIDRVHPIFGYKLTPIEYPIKYFKLAKKQYSLTGVCIHIGNTNKYGHYYAFVKNMHNEMCDDYIDFLFLLLSILIRLEQFSNYILMKLSKLFA
ncbi:hypothetical protein RFI_38961, partial [Reticulomyxa filosa]